MFKEIAKRDVSSVLVGVPRRTADLGIELEVEGVSLPSSVPNWMGKAEGSLQGGIEYITKPIKIDNVEPYTNNLDAYLKAEGATILPSYRCSTHIHLNATADSVADTLGAIFLFTVFEQVLLKLCGQERNGNLFCMSSADTGEIVWYFDNLCKQFHEIERAGFSFSRGKYSSLNIDRLRDLGTLEARCFPLCVKEVDNKFRLDAVKLKSWCMWLMNIKAMAKAEPDKTFRSLWKNIRQNPEWYCIKIFGDDFWKLHEPIIPLMETGTEIGYELTRTLKKWYNTETVSAPKRRPRKVPAPAMAVYDDIVVDDTEF